MTVMIDDRLSNRGQSRKSPARRNRGDLKQSSNANAPAPTINFPGFLPRNRPFLTHPLLTMGRMDQSELREMTPDQLSTLVAGLHAGRCAMDRRLLEVVLAYDARGAWKREGDGATSMADWVAAFLGVTHETATRMVRVARKLQCLPRLGKAYSEGRLSWDKVRFLCRVATPETEARLVSDALGMTALDVETEGRRVLRARRLETLDESGPATHLRSRSDPDARGTWFWGFLSEGDDDVVIDEL